MTVDITHDLACPVGGLACCAGDECDCRDEESLDDEVCEYCWCIACLCNE